MTIPDGWVEIPRNFLNKAEAEMYKVAPSQNAHYDYGFQSSDFRNGITYPYILIRIRTTGKISESELERINSYDPLLNDKQASQMSSLVSNLHFGRPIYDKENKIIWDRVDSYVNGVGKVYCLSGLFPSELGVSAGYRRYYDVPA